jgi:hypothetical protein
VCRELTGVKNENGYIMPGTTLMFRLWKRSDLTQLIQEPDVAESTYYSANPTTNNKTFKVVLTDLSLTYEMLELSSQDKLDKARRSAAKYFVDVPRLVLTHVPAGQMESHHKIQLGVGTKFVAVTWVKSDQMFHNSTSKKHLAAHFHFPPKARKVSFELEGQPLLFAKGIRDIGVSPEKAHASRTCRELHKSMFHTNLYSKGFDKMFPASGMAHDQVFILDLGHKTFKAPAELSVDVEYTADSSQDKWLLCAITVAQCSYSLKDKEALKWEILT